MRADHPTGTIDRMSAVWVAQLRGQALTVLQWQKLSKGSVLPSFTDRQIAMNTTHAANSRFMASSTFGSSAPNN